MKKIFTLLAIFAVIVFGAFAVLLKAKGNNQYSNVSESFHVIYEDHMLSKKQAMREDGQYFLSLDAIQKYFDENAQYDDAKKAVVLNNGSGEKVLPLNSREATINGAKIGLRDPLIQKDETIYVPVEAFAHDYPVRMNYNKDKNVLVIDDRRKEHGKGVLSGDGVNMRESATTNAPIVDTLDADSDLLVFGKEDDWYRVRERDGLLGWIREDNIKVETLDGKYTRKSSEPIKSAIEKPLNITYDYTYSQVKDDVIAGIKPIEGLDVVIPTWFSIENAAGDIKDRGDIRYVENYAKLGIATWAYLDNSFDPNLTHEFLQNDAARQKAVAMIVNLAKSYGMKGINIDFENMKVDDRDGLTQFVREVSEAAKAENLLVSVCVTPQISKEVEHEIYDRKALADVSDYVILMAYDQHWGSSDKAGSVAEYKWVEGNINLSLKDIPPEKFILSVPFYARLWQETPDGLDSTAVGMQTTVDYVKTHNLEPVWDDEAKQYTIQQNINGKSEKIWVEDADSVAWKVSLMRKYNLAGISSWRLGFETPDVWTAISNQFSKYQYLYR
ncbi:MAG: glycosyl hydrolase family 18 protein [Peptoniphilus sp.]|nr:glycosyl hydrolase family 18 protein [Peptoniphilus sp.]MDD7363361.1 glycosyl hydrolase family 18 protein [Bacillota bacterium]MDY6044280.1 glycosyl hydrolase family 18 protein [Peptoniphilus sp.]